MRSPFGPLLLWELVRLGRAGTLRRLRVGLALAMLVGLFVAYLQASPASAVEAIFGGEVTPGESAKFAETFLVAFLCVQTLAVVVLTPVIVAGGLAEDKQRGRLDFLRSSMLSPREIVLGQYAARVLHTLGVVAVGLPILTLSMLFGGVNASMLLAGTLVAGATVLSLGAYSLMLAARKPALRDVLVVVTTNVTALTVFGLVCGCLPVLSAASPFSALLYIVVTSEARWDHYFVYHTAGYLAVHGVVTLVCLRSAIRAVANPPLDARQLLTPDDRPPMPTYPPTYPQAYPAGFRDFAVVEDSLDDPLDRAGWDAASLQRDFFVPEVDDADPFAWKERHFSARFSQNVNGAVWGCGVVLAVLAFFVVVTVFFVGVVRQLDARYVGDRAPLKELAQTLAAGGVFVVIVSVAGRVAVSVVGERERQSLDGLLLIPGDRRDILVAKWAAPLRALTYPLGVLGFVELTVALVGTVSPLTFVLATAHFAAATLFAATLGLWLSVRCRTVTRAVTWALTAVLCVVLLPLVFAPVAAALELAATGGRSELLSTLAQSFSPPIGLWEVHFAPGERLTVARVLLAFVAPAAYATTAALLWRLALQRFRNG